MQCPLCKVEMAITKATHIAEGDNSAETPTKIFMQHELSCRNKKCTNYNKVVQVVKNPLN